MASASEPAGQAGADCIPQAFEHAPTALLVVDAAGTIVLANRSAGQLCGCAHAQLPGQPLSRFVPARHADGLARLLAGAADPTAGGHAGAPLALELQRADGRLLPVECTVAAIRAPSGPRVLASLVDATASRAASDRFRELVEAAPNAKVVVDRQRRIQLVNRSAEALFGYSREELLGASLDLLVPARLRQAHAAFVEAFFAAPATRPMGSGRELSGLRKDGTEVPVAIGLAPIASPEGLLALASMVDVTERRAYEDRLRRGNAELAAMNRELDEFVYTASHDLRAPLTGISTVAQWILEDDDTLAPKTRERLGIIQGRIRRMGQLLRDIHEYARSGRTAEQSGPRSTAAALVRGVVDTLQLPPGFEVVADASLDSVEVLRMPLEQVLHNLVGNAIKHHDAGGGSVHVSVQRRPGGLRFAVRDDGPGIPPEYRASVFEMFRTLRPRDEVEGSGMGLALVQKIVARMGGECGIDGVEPHGTCVWFDWPLAR